MAPSKTAPRPLANTQHQEMPNYECPASLECLIQPGGAGWPALAPWLRLESVVALGQPLLFAGALAA